MSSRSRVVVAETAEEARAHRDAWMRLHERRADDNLFLRPEMLLPMLEHAAASVPFCMPFVYDEHGELIGVAIFSSGADAGAGLAGMVSSWEHPLFLDATPLLDRTRADAAAAALWSWLRDERRPWSFVRWSRVRLESAAWTALAGAMDADGSRWWTRRAYRRPALDLPPTWDDYLAGLSRSRRKRLRRIERRLESAGTVGARISERPAEAVDRFLQLEAAGWKGDEGTALACDPGQERFFREAAGALAESCAGYFVELLLDGRPIAITANFIDGETLYAYKTAYDPEFAGLSPGIAVEIALVRALLGGGRVAVIDSCAGADSYLSDLWGDHRTIGEVVVAIDVLSALSIAAAPHVRRSRRLARGLWRSLRRAAG